MGGESSEKDEKNLKRKKLKRNEKGNLLVPGEYLGPWAGYSGLESERNKKEKLKRFTNVVNKNCIEENKEITRSFGTATLKAKQFYKKEEIGNSYREIKVYNDHRREVTHLKFLSEYNGWLSSSLDGHSKGISYLSTCRSDSLLCTGSYDKTFRIWNLTTSGRFLYKYNLESEILCGTHGGDDLFYLGGPNGTISRIDLRARNNFDKFKVVNSDSQDPSLSILENGLCQMELIDENNLAFNLYNGSFGILDIRNPKKPSLKNIKTEPFCRLDSSNLVYYDDSSLYKLNIKDCNSIKLTGEIDKITTNLISKEFEVIFSTETGVFSWNMEKEELKMLYNLNSRISCLDIEKQLIVGEVSGKVKLLESMDDEN